MPKLIDLISLWVKQHPTLNDHYRVEVFNATNQRGRLYFACNNDGGMVDIYDQKLVWYGAEAHASDPSLFKRLEEYLIIYHDRASVTNIVMFRTHCGHKLHNCPTEKAFCAC